MRRDVAVPGAVGAAVGGVVVAAVFAGLDAVRPDTYVVTAKALSAPGAISADGGGWTYSIPTDVTWRDVRGTVHTSGRPECLPPSGKEEGPIRFTAVPVDADGLKFRQVVYLECM